MVITKYDIQELETVNILRQVVVMQSPSTTAI